MERQNLGMPKHTKINDEAIKNKNDFKKQNIRMI